MKKCSYCGTEYPDDAVECAIDHTLFAQASEPSIPEPKQPENDETQLSAEDLAKNLVTVTTCGTMAEADLLVSRLRAAGIEAFMPDECLMWGGRVSSTYVYRVEVSPNDYNAARDLIS